MARVYAVLFALLATPAGAHQVFIYICDFQDTTANLGYDEHELVFPLHYQNEITLLKGGRVEGGEFFKSTPPDRELSLDIKSNGAALLALSDTEIFEGTCARP